MAEEVGQVSLGLNLDQKHFNKQINSLASGSKATVSKAFSPIGKMITAALSVAAITSFAKSCIELGSTLNEVQNVVDVTFNTMSGAVNDFSTNAMTQFGLSESVTKSYVGTLGAMASSMGFTEQEAYNMSTALTGLTGDVASFYNLSSDEAFNKLKGVFTGETEAIKSLGVVMTQTALDEYALNNGFGKTTAKMTEQEKAALRYQYVMSNLSKASGDFIRTSDSWANQTKILSLQFDALKASLGQGLINLFTPLIKQLNLFIARLKVAADTFKAFTETMMGKNASDTHLRTGLFPSRRRLRMWCQSQSPR